MPTTETERFALSSAPALNAGPPHERPRELRVYTDRYALIRVSRSTPADVDTAMPIAPHQPELVNVPSGHRIWFALQPGEVSGNIWITG